MAIDLEQRQYHIDMICILSRGFINVEKDEHHPRVLRVAVNELKKHTAALDEMMEKHLGAV